MKIVHITDELMPSAGGLVSVPINLAAAQAARGHKVVLIGRTGSRELLDSGETQKIPHFENVQLVDCQQPGLPAKLFPHKTSSILKKHITEEAVVHLHGVWDPILLLASKIARKRGIPYIVTPHSMLHPWQMKRFAWQKKIVFAIGWRNMFAKALFIHTLNTDEKQYVETFGFGAPIEIIPNGIYPESMEAVDPNPFLEKHPELKTIPYILFLSRLHNQKGIVHLLDGFEEFAKANPDIALVLAGPDYGELSIIEKKLAQMTAANRVRIPGPIYGDEKMGALHGASCFALTSLNEGFSVDILEALACGLPVVISKNCYFPEVEEAGAGIVAELHPRSIATALEKIFSHSGMDISMGENAKTLAENSYHWKTIAEKTEVLYEKHFDH
jgi:glycosyltransferase involved in cell wall biosynthesis